jgi:hypothetical protein
MQNQYLPVENVLNVCFKPVILWLVMLSLLGVLFVLNLVQSTPITESIQWSYAVVQYIEKFLAVPYGDVQY